MSVRSKNKITISKWVRKISVNLMDIRKLNSYNLIQNTSLYCECGTVNSSCTKYHWKHFLHMLCITKIVILYLRMIWWMLWVIGLVCTGVVIHRYFARYAEFDSILITKTSTREHVPFPVIIICADSPHSQEKCNFKY